MAAAAGGAGPRGAPVPRAGDRTGGALNPPLALDLDGTLIDCRVRQVEVAAAALSRLGAPPLDRPRFWRAKRGGLTTAAALSRLGHPSDVVAAAAALWAAEIESDANLALDAPLPGVARLLAGLRRQGRRIAILTARVRPEAARAQLAGLGLAALADVVEVVSPADAATAKRALLSALRATAYIGDSEADHRAAAGLLPFAAVSTGQRSPGYLRRAGVAPVAPSLAAALRLVGALRPT